MPEVKAKARFRRGQRVRVPSGTPYTSTDPQYPSERISKRSHTVYVVSVSGPDVLVLGTVSVRNTRDFSQEFRLSSRTRIERAARAAGWGGEGSAEAFLEKVIQESALSGASSPAVIVTHRPYGDIQVAVHISGEQVMWAGSGGYWKRADAAHLEPA